MALSTGPTSSWMQSLDFPSRLFETGSNDYELYEEDDEFVLSVEMPGFDPEEISVSWDSGVLNIAAEHEDDAITAEYTNGILEVRLPVLTGATVSGTEIEVQA